MRKTATARLYGSSNHVHGVGKRQPYRLLYRSSHQKNEKGKTFIVKGGGEQAKSFHNGPRVKYGDLQNTLRKAEEEKFRGENDGGTKCLLLGDNETDAALNDGDGRNTIYSLSKALHSISADVNPYRPALSGGRRDELNTLKSICGLVEGNDPDEEGSDVIKYYYLRIRRK